MLVPSRVTRPGGLDRAPPGRDGRIQVRNS
jgi:hypothetical protein